MEDVDESLRYAHDVGFDEGWQEGYEEGYAVGYEDGKSAVAERLSEHIRRGHEILGGKDE